MKILIVGCGISGVTIGRIMAEEGYKIEIWDRRCHIGGNMYDYLDEHGIKVHKYGPHIFHTNNESVWRFVNRFEDWEPYRLVCGAVWDGKYTPTAFNFNTIDTFYEPGYAEVLKKKLLASYPGRSSASVVEVMKNPDPDIRGYAEYLFQKDYAPYTAKQWGVLPEDIDVSVLTRVPLRFSYEEKYFTDKYEAMPKHSYKEMFENMLKHPNITVRLGIEALDHISIVNNHVLIDCNESKDTIIVFTGALDELFSFKFGALPYRSLRFEWKYEEIDSLQDAPVVAYPQAEGFTRITEYKKLPCQNVSGTSYAVEYPLLYIEGKGVEPYYPVLTDESQKRYLQYFDSLIKLDNLICCGRLADYKYYNMDQAIEAAFKKTRILKKLIEFRLK